MKNIILILFNLQSSHLEMIFHLFLGIKSILKILIIIKLNILQNIEKKIIKNLKNYMKGMIINAQLKNYLKIIIMNLDFVFLIMI